MSEQLSEGTIIGDRYRITRPLGSGGFGTVYAAQHVLIKRDVALKVLDRLIGHPHADRLASRFLREAELAARVEHPNIVTVYDFGFTGGQEIQVPYLAMQMLEGHDLKDELDATGALDPARALPLFIDTLDGLALAHAQEIVHKDLKPRNLLLRHPGTPRESLCIVDFGLACLLDRTVARLTQSGHLSGTPRYLSPEYIRDQFASPALDVYQMGLILVEALAGAPVVQSDDLYVVLMAHCSGKLPIPSALLDSPLRPVLERALALDPNERFPDAGAFRDALAAIDPADISASDGAFRLLNEGEPSGEATVPSGLAAVARQAAADSDADRSAPSGSGSSGRPTPPEPLPDSLLDAKAPSMDLSIDTSEFDGVPRRRARPTILIAAALLLLVGAGVAALALGVFGGEGEVTEVAPPPQPAPAAAAPSPDPEEAPPIEGQDPTKLAEASPSPDADADAEEPAAEDAAPLEPPAEEAEPEPEVEAPLTSAQERRKTRAAARRKARRQRRRARRKAAPAASPRPTRKPTLSIVE